MNKNTQKNDPNDNYAMYAQDRRSDIVSKKAVTGEGNAPRTLKFHESYLRMEANALRKQARKEARGSGFEPIFDKGYSVGINAEGSPFVQIHFTINGSSQCSNCAI